MPAVDHWRMFAEFCRYEKAVGGPSPHAAMVAGMIRGLPVQEQVWRVGCYGGVYNTGGALALWTALSRESVLGMGEPALRGWLKENWEGLPFRRERRAVRTPEKLARYLYSYALYSRDWPDRDWWHGAASRANYEAGWHDVLSVYGVGRYIAIRMLELFSRSGAGTASYDIRALDAWSPRRTLSLLWPHHTQMLSRDLSRQAAAGTEKIANTTLQRLRDEFGVELSHYELQVMTCEYRQSIEKRRQYPGRSIDSEDRYLREITPYWGAPVAEPGWRVRRELFPEVSLGELNGWQGARDELGTVAAVHGYTWSDLVYDYKATTDLAHPAMRVEVHT